MAEFQINVRFNERKGCWDIGGARIVGDRPANELHASTGDKRTDPLDKRVRDHEVLSVLHGLERGENR